MNVPNALHEYALALDAARDYAQVCVSNDNDWTEETLGHNIQSNFGPELSEVDCDDIARSVLGEE